jgi:hypothetical protein
MSSRNVGQPRLYHFMKRVLEGRVSPLEYIALIGSFSTLVLLYISLHVCFFNLSKEIAAEGDRFETLLERNVRLMARYNELAAPARIIPLAIGYGMQPGTPNEVERFAVSADGATDGDRSWAEAVLDKAFELAPPPEARAAQ